MTARSRSLAVPSHTPGPWESFVLDHSILISGPGREGFCEVRRYYEDLRDAANANLIVAAPDLLSGCNALLGLLQLLSVRADVSPALRAAMNESHRIEEAKAATAKAAGQPLYHDIEALVSAKPLYSRRKLEADLLEAREALRDLLLEAEPELHRHPTATAIVDRARAVVAALSSSSEAAVPTNQEQSS